MPTLFPGMDPYLEQSGVWEQIHTGLIVAIQRYLTPLLRPHYHVGIERRTYLALLPLVDMIGMPDVLISDAGTKVGLEVSLETITLPEVY